MGRKFFAIWQGRLLEPRWSSDYPHFLINGEINARNYKVVEEAEAK